MKRLTLVIFACLIGGVPCAARVQKGARPVVKRPAVSEVAYCELVRHPNRYRNKRLTVAANLFGGFEVSALEDFQCDEDRSIWVEFSDSYKTCTPADVTSAFDNIFRGGTMSSNRAMIVATGRFQIARGFKKSPRAFLNGFGHLGRYPFQFTLNCLKSVKPAPWT